jgi:hypothetical protein
MNQRCIGDTFVSTLFYEKLVTLYERLVTVLCKIGNSTVETMHRLGGLDAGMPP